MGRLCGRCRLAGHNRATCQIELDENGNAIGVTPPKEEPKANPSNPKPIAPYPPPSAASYPSHGQPPVPAPPGYQEMRDTPGPVRYMQAAYAPPPQYVYPRGMAHSYGIGPEPGGAHHPYIHQAQPVADYAAEETAMRRVSNGPQTPTRRISHPEYRQGPSSSLGPSPPSGPSYRGPQPPAFERSLPYSIAAITDASPSPTPSPAAGKPKKEMSARAFKRSRPWRANPSVDTRARIARALTQRMYLVDREKKGNIEESFAVLGSTGNIYKVTVGELMKCTCPDFAKKNNSCKHLLFVMLKVLKLPSDSQYVYQVALLPNELAEIFRSAPPDPRDVVANEKVRDTYKKLQSGAPWDEEAEGSQANRIRGAKPVEGDCPICYEEMSAQGEAVSMCRTCGNYVHQNCFQNWERTSRGRTVRCVLCRGEWNDMRRGAGPAGVLQDKGYTNMAQLQGMSSRRDTSTYYRRPHHGGYYAYEGGDSGGGEDDDDDEDDDGGHGGFGYSRRSYGRRFAPYRYR